MSLDNELELTIEACKILDGENEKLTRQNQELMAQVELLQQSLLKCAELVNVDGDTAIDWLLDNHHNLRQQAKVK